MSKTCSVLLPVLTALCVSVWASPFNLPPTVRAGERLAAEMAAPGLDYNDPVALVCPGRDDVRCATVEINPDALLDLYWPAGDFTSPLPVVLFIAELPRSKYIASNEKPYRRYVPVVAWAADLAARGMIAVVPDTVLPSRDYPRILDWLEKNGAALGMDPSRQAYFCTGYASSFLPFLMGLDNSKSVRALVLYYGVITPDMGLTLRADIALQWVKVGMGTYLTKHYPAMEQVMKGYGDQGNPIDVIELPKSYPFFDWKQLDAESAAALEKTLIFLEKNLH